ncbi:MAG: prepilin-type N-terminal cleavage/methylation domain-containing protein, partial [Erysipelotrichaceae bacterium]|nr:prepilin-type N-terminal cleavage/methylation domain-containing protein [Erysipelotrichaceae bacterium]
MKKGFTLVELLAVIAILAILIIIALPNVLEMFNNAKKDVFVTEVKT